MLHYVNTQNLDCRELNGFTSNKVASSEILAFNLINKVSNCTVLWFKGKVKGGLNTCLTKKLHRIRVLTSLAIQDSLLLFLTLASIFSCDVRISFLSAALPIFGFGLCNRPLISRAGLKAFVWSSSWTPIFSLKLELQKNKIMAILKSHICFQYSLLPGMNKETIWNIK